MIGLKKSFRVLKAKFNLFDWKDWITFSIGLTLILTYLVVTLLEWHFRSIAVEKAFLEVKGTLDESNVDSAKLQKLIYPNATLLFWGGSTYWFTFMSNVLMGVTMFLYPFYRTSKKAQRFYFASMVYIIIVVAVYWGGVATDPTLMSDSQTFEWVKTSIMHGAAPFLGLLTLVGWERKRIRISNVSIWSFMIYPIAYLFFTFAIYAFGHKFMQFGGTELERGVAIYSVVSYLHPFNYKGNSTLVIVVLDIMLLLFAMFSAPALGFFLRKVLRILKPGQKALSKIYFISPKVREAIRLKKLQLNKQREEYKAKKQKVKQLRKEQKLNKQK